MGKFIFCIGNKAKVPYTFRTTGINVYTMEELCYYLYHNIDTLEEDIGDIQLVSWIRTELGMTERAAREKGIDYKVGKFPFTASGKATAAGERDGFIKLIADARTDELLGAHMVGANVSEMVGGIVAARNLGVKASDIMKSVFPHPSMSEAIMEAAAAIHGEAIHI